MNVGVEALFTSALGLKSPWEVVKVELDTAKRRIDFEVACDAKQLPCPACGVNGQGIHDRVRRDWRHLDFFQHEAWLHADVPRVDCGACGKTTTVELPWARPGSGFTLLFEAFALSLCQPMPVAHAAALLRVNSKQLWRRIEHYVGVARAQEKMSGVAVVGIDDLSFRRCQDYVTVVHDLETKRLLFMTEGRKHGTVIEFKADLIAHGGNPDDIKHVCMDMSAAYTKGVTEALPQAQISFDRFHVIALANEAMDTVRRDEMRDQPRVVRAAMGTERKAFKGMFWGMRKDHSDWSVEQINTMYRLQRSNLKSARAWRLKEGLRSSYATGVTSNCPEKAEAALKSWMSWARRSRLEPFKKLATTLKDRLAGVVRSMLDGRSNAYVDLTATMPRLSIIRITTKRNTNMTRMHNPPHPGEMLKEDVLPALGLTVTDAAEQLSVSRVALSRVINGRAAISAELAIRLAQWLGGSAEIWLRAQLQYDLWHAEQKSTAKVIPASYEAAKAKHPEL